MRFTLTKLILVLLFLFKHHVTGNRRNISNQSSPYIVGGYDCTAEMHPFMVSIGKTYNWKHMCGGTLINEYWVLTAAHCCNFFPNRYYLSVQAGLSRIQRTNVKYSKVLRTYLHPKFNYQTLEDDICLILLMSPIYKGQGVDYVNIPDPAMRTGDLEETCEDHVVMGWGDQFAKNEYGEAIKPPLPYKPQIQCVNISVLTSRNCNNMGVNVFGGKVICAKASHKDACQGDSGGPLMCNDVQVGIVSDGVGCALDRYAGTYTRVDRYHDFIIKTILANTGLTRKIYCKFVIAIVIVLHHI